jgi:hypothetical protein|tara:strand:- start:66973 stop:67794 length:822 start_codon:yes stop_codon:yes gene_type:complete
MSKKKIIGWVSCGITSAVACKQAIMKYGKDKIELYYMKIDSAHPDNDRFLKDLEKWYDLPITTIRSDKYKDQFEVIEHTGYVNGAEGARCTLELKKKVRWGIEENIDFSAQIFGFEFVPKEVNRALRFNEQYPKAKAIFPLIETYLTKENCAEILRFANIELPTMYKLGYPNNNCIGCVKGGMGYWNKIRVDFPEHFDKMAKAERVAGFSCLKTEKEGRIFLDELNPKRGRKMKVVMPDCGTYCEVEFEGIEHPMLKKILDKEVNIEQLRLVI